MDLLRGFSGFDVLVSVSAGGFPVFIIFLSGTFPPSGFFLGTPGDLEGAGPTGFFFDFELLPFLPEPTDFIFIGIFPVDPVDILPVEEPEPS